MRASKLFYTQRCLSRSLRRSLSSSKQNVESSLQSELFDKLTTRPPHIIYDYLSPTPSHLLNISLADFIPPTCYPANFSSSKIRLPYAQASNDKSRLPQSHHLVYLNPQLPSNVLFPDGTDPLQSPGPPFMRRMWAGGSIAFNKLEKYQLLLNNTRAVCIERIVDVTVKGGVGDEKVFVNIERRIGPVDSDSSTPLAGSAIDQQLLSRYRTDDADYIGQAALVESRNIVFMREKDKDTAKKDQMRPLKVIRPTRKPDFSVRVIPTQSLLFRFSALTFNAHSIHLDPQYCREIEGHRNLLVHGPLSLVLMLTVLRSQLRKGEIIKQFDYRNLAPLYVNEELRVCVGKKTDDEHKYEVWIEGQEGGYAVKGSAVVGPLEISNAGQDDKLSTP